jgi:hypothetical protein
MSPGVWIALPYAVQMSDAAGGFQSGQYRLNIGPENSVSIRGRARFTANGTTGMNASAGTNITTALPLAFQPSASQGWPVPVYGSPTISANRIPSIVIGQTGAGILTIFNVSSVTTNLVTVDIDITGTYYL